MGFKKLVFYGLGFILIFFPFQLWGNTPELDALEKQARAYYSTDLDSSRFFAMRVSQLAQIASNHEKVAWADNWIAITYIKNGRADSAGYYLDRCIEYCEAHDVSIILGKARLNQSINANQQGDYEHAMNTGLRALKHFQAINDTLGVAHAQYNTGLSLQRLERKEAAMDFYRRALAVYLEKGSVIDRANTLNAIGTIWTSRELPDSALHYYLLAADQKLAVNARAFCGSEFSNIAAIHEKAGRMKLAEAYYTQSYQAFTQIGDQRGRALVAGNLSHFKLGIQDWDSAIYYGKISADHAALSQDQFLLSKSHERLADAYSETQNFELSLLHYRQFDSISELISDAEVQKNVDELHISYETERREKELLEERYLSQRKTFWLLGSCAGIFVLVFALVLIYRREQERKKKLMALAQINLESERHRISMDLHDHLGAELSIITSQLDMNAFRATDNATREMLERLARQGRMANSQLRETIWSVQSTTITLTQFCLKTREFADRILGEAEMAFSCEQDGEANLAPGEALDLYRVMQEGINNAVKYSHASALSMKAQVKGQTLLLELQDNGNGIADASTSVGNGLQNMEARVISRGGKFTLIRKPGTTIQVELPVKA